MTASAPDYTNEPRRRVSTTIGPASPTVDMLLAPAGVSVPPMSDVAGILAGVMGRVSLEERLRALRIRRWCLDDRRWVALRDPAREGGDPGLTLPSEVFGRLFDRSFPALAKNRWKMTSNGSYVTYFQRASEGDLAAVRAFFDSLGPAVVIQDLTEASLALGFHAKKAASGSVRRTDLGQLIHEAKPYGAPATAAHRKAGTELARRLREFVDAMPLFKTVDGFVAVPSSDPKPLFSLPRGFAANLAKHTGKADLSGALTKPKATEQTKNLVRADKIKALLGSVTVDRRKVAGRTLVVVDDLYQSGVTLNYIAEELRAAGARTIFGLATVKTLRNDDNVSGAAAPTRAAVADTSDADDEDFF